MIVIIYHTPFACLRSVVMKSICVYLGANHGNSPVLSDTVVVLGEEIAKAGYRLVYGGSSQGLMGLLASSVMLHGGKITGVITKQLITQEQPLTTLDELIVVETMQERKLVMQQQSDAFIVMPGGLGTLEEAFDTWNAIKIGVFNKPIGFLNIEGYFDGLFSFISNCENKGFITSSQVRIPKINADPRLLLNSLIQYEKIMDTETLA